MIRIISLFLFVSSILFSQELHFNRGVNLTGWFQVPSVRDVHFTKFTYDDFADIKSLGVDVIRLPINLHFMTNGAPNYTIDPLFYFFLDQVIDWAEELGINLILDNHTFDVTQNTAPNIDQVLIPVWTQMAEHYKNRSNFIYFEILNEPHGISDIRWNEIQLDVVEAIRQIDQKHTLIVGPAGWNSYNNLSQMPIYDDDNLIYTFHFYDPFIFTHQGASWTDPSMVPLGGVPFPYNSSTMPLCPPELKGTWIEWSINNYPNDGKISKVQELIDIAVDFQSSRNAELFCGEFGVLYDTAPNADRTYWYDVVRSYFEQNNISWTIWDYKGGFGIYEKQSNELFDYDLNIPLVEALGFEAPPQYTYQLLPDSSNFDLYTDYIGELIFGSSYTSSGTLDFYYQIEPHDGEFCINWNGADQYNHIGFNFVPDKDLSYLVSEEYVLDFWMKGNTQTTIDIRFIDTKTDVPEDHPWRMRYTISNSDLNFDGSWYNLRIPLDSFEEHGSWDNGWFEPVGDFDWQAIDRFEIVAEHSNLTSIDLWFDEIKIVNPGISGVYPGVFFEDDYVLKQNYPNPFNPVTKIEFNLSKDGFTKLQIYNQLGQLITELIHDELSRGYHHIEFDASGLSSGIYIYRLTSGEFFQSKMMLLLK